MMCPATTEALKVYLPSVDVDIGDLPERVLTSRQEEMRHLRSIREFSTAERWGWLTLTGAVLRISGITRLDAEAPSTPLRVLEALGPVHVATKHIPGLSEPVRVVTDPDGEAFFKMACTKAATLLVSGRPVTTDAVQADMRAFLSGMVAP